MTLWSTHFMYFQLYLSDVQSHLWTKHNLDIYVRWECCLSLITVNVIALVFHVDDLTQVFGRDTEGPVYAYY